MGTSRWSKVMENVAGGAFIVAMFLTPMLRSWRTRWGTTAQEANRPLPSDYLAPFARWEYTHGVTIMAPPESVWPWLVQLGQGRGGFYSYAGLENLIGCHTHNTRRIMPEFQHLKTGDGLRLHPNIPAIPVVAVEPYRTIVLGGNLDLSAQEPRAQAPLQDDSAPHLAVSWIFALNRTKEGWTRLITRFRASYLWSLANAFFCGPLLIEPVSFVMERKMLLTIKALAEAQLMAEAQKIPATSKPAAAAAAIARRTIRIQPLVRIWSRAWYTLKTTPLKIRIASKSQGASLLANERKATSSSKAKDRNM